LHVWEEAGDPIPTTKDQAARNGAHKIGKTRRYLIKGRRATRLRDGNPLACCDP
jgi:hypothetical protein